MPEPFSQARLHLHTCSSCGDPVTCCCPDRRQVDRATGKVRKILCIFCDDLEKQLRAFFANEKVELERIQ